jgi:glucokinase
MIEVVLAVDLGGTNIRMAAVSADGGIHSRSRAETPTNVSPTELIELTVRMAGECCSSLPDDSKITAVGFASPAPAALDSGGVLGKLPNLPTLNGMDLAAALRSHLPYPVVLENDATAAAIGEHWLGASKGFSNVIHVTLGTGVGGGLIINGNAYRGVDGTAGEIGHICVEPEGHPCGCGSRGCIEQYASATAVGRMGRESGFFYETALDIYNAAKGGDPAAGSVMANVGRYLGIMLAGLINTLNPEMVVIGGGMAASWDLIVGPIDTEIRQRAFSEPVNRVKIARTLLHDDAGILGVACSAHGLA